MSSDVDIVFPSDDESGNGAIFPSENSDATGDPQQNDSEAVALSDTSTSPSASKSKRLDSSHLPVLNREELDYVSGVLVSKCCDKDCLFHLSANSVLTLLRKFSSLGANAQLQWLGDRIHENSTPNLEKGMLNTRYTVGGQEVCLLAWCAVLHISPKRVSRVAKSVSLGMVTAEHGNKGKKRINTKSEIAKAWMNHYFHLVGDHMPHNKQIHLPSWETQKDIYSRLKEDMKQEQMAENEIVSLSLFYKIWNSDFHNVVIPEVRHPLRLICSECHCTIFFLSKIALQNVIFVLKLKWKEEVV